MRNEHKPAAWLLEESECWPAIVTFDLAKMEKVKSGLTGLGKKIVVPLYRPGPEYVFRMDPATKQAVIYAGPEMIGRVVEIRDTGERAGQPLPPRGREA